MVARSNREELIIATKYSSAYTQDGSESTIRANRGGNATKSMVQSLEKSLQRLQTRYVDIVSVTPLRRPTERDEKLIVWPALRALLGLYDLYS